MSSGSRSDEHYGELPFDRVRARVLRDHQRAARQRMLESTLVELRNQIGVNLHSSARGSVTMSAGDPQRARLATALVIVAALLGVVLGWQSTRAGDEEDTTPGPMWWPG